MGQVGGPHGFCGKSWSPPCHLQAKQMFCSVTPGWPNGQPGQFGFYPGGFCGTSATLQPPTKHEQNHKAKTSKHANNNAPPVCPRPVILSEPPVGLSLNVSEELKWTSVFLPIPLASYLHPWSSLSFLNPFRFSIARRTRKYKVDLLGP